jgi:hypothetical protein
MYQTYIKVVIGTAATAADSANEKKYIYMIYQGCTFSFNVCDRRLNVYFQPLHLLRCCLCWQPTCIIVSILSTEKKYQLTTVHVLIILQYLLQTYHVTGINMF